MTFRRVPQRRCLDSYHTPSQSCLRSGSRLLVSDAEPPNLFVTVWCYFFEEDPRCCIDPVCGICSPGAVLLRSTRRLFCQTVVGRPLLRRLLHFNPCSTMWCSPPTNFVDSTLFGRCISLVRATQPANGSLRRRDVASTYSHPVLRQGRGNVCVPQQ